MKRRRPRKISPDRVTVAHTSAELGAAVRDARRRTGIPIDRAALLAGVSKQFMCDLEAGKPTLQLGKAIDVAREFGVEIHLKPRGLPDLQPEAPGDDE